MQTKQIAQFERQNPFLSVNVLYYDSESREVIPLNSEKYIMFEIGYV